MFSKKALPLWGAFLGAVAIFIVPVVWGASVALLLLCALAIASWKANRSKR
jgi:hypothetical protein